MRFKLLNFLRCVFSRHRFTPSRSHIGKLTYVQCGFRKKP